jgi:hypothetical protein
MSVLIFEVFASNLVAPGCVKPLTAETEGVENLRIKMVLLDLDDEGLHQQVLTQYLLTSLNSQILLLLNCIWFRFYNGAVPGKCFR